MPSHYIQVGKLKIDQDLMDVICPAAGYTPELICPAAGYEKIIPDFIRDETYPTVDIDSSSTEQIILICSDQVGGEIRFYISRSTGNYSYTIFGNEDAVLDSGVISATNWLYNFTGMDGYPSNGFKTFKVVLKPLTGVFTELRGYSTSVIYPLLEFYLNTPSLNRLSLRNCQLLKYGWMCDNMDSFTYTGEYVFGYTYLLEKLRMPLSMNAVTSITYWFHYSGIKEVVLPASMSACTNFDFLFNFAETKKVTWPRNSPVLIRLRDAVSSSKIKSIVFPETFPSTLYLYYFAQNSSLEYFKFHSGLNKLTFVLGLFKNCPNVRFDNDLLKIPIGAGSSTISNISDVISFNNFVKKVHFDGTAEDSPITTIYTPSNCLMLEEVIYPEIMNSMTVLTINIVNCPNLKKLVMPLSMSGLTTPGVNIGSASSPNIEEITTCNNWGSTQFSLTMTNLKKLKAFIQPSMKMVGIAAGSGNLEFFDVDFEAIGSSNYNFSLNKFGVTEINRIFSVLPDISLLGITATINFTGNPGYAACDPSIATAKGWTVT